MANSATKTKRPVGRPRADGKAHLSRGVLLKTTAKLIAANGYAGTSIRKIAKTLDVSIASIFNLYSSKDKLLNALIEFAATPSLKFYDELNAIDLPAPVALFKSILEEGRAVASVDSDYAAVFYLPELRQEEFAKAQASRARMVSHYARLIRRGIKEGALHPVDVKWTAEQIFQLSETSILTGGKSSPSAIDRRARSTAKFCLRGLLITPRQLELIEIESTQIDLKIEVDA